MILGKLANCLLPPMVSEVDVVEGQRHLKIRTSENYTTIWVDGVEFFFIRESGKYDGYGRMQTDRRRGVH